MHTFFLHIKFIIVSFCLLNVSFAQINTSHTSKVIKNQTKGFKKEIRSQLEKQYANFMEATMNKNSVLACSLIHPDSKTIQANGEVWDASKSCEYMTASFRQVVKTYKAEFKLDTIFISGDTAEVLIHQYWHRSQMKAGKIREVETMADQWEKWVLKDGIYLRFKIDRVVPKIWKVDGKRVDPFKRYDPGAPEFKG